MAQGQLIGLICLKFLGHLSLIARAPSARLAGLVEKKEEDGEGLAAIVHVEQAAFDVYHLGVDLHASFLTNLTAQG